MEYYVARNVEEIRGSKIWTLQNIMNGKYVNVSDIELKNGIRRKKVDVANLTLTSDDRLVKAAEYKFEAFEDMMKAPAELAGRLKASSKEISEHIERSLDREIADCLRVYSDKYKKYVTIKMTDNDKNLIVAQFKFGIDSFLLIKYQKIVYGIDVETGNLHFDCLVGVEAIRCGDVCKSIKSVPSRLSFYGDGKRISDEIRDSGDYLTIHRSSDGNFVLDTEEEKLTFASAIMRAIADQMDEVVLENPQLANNADIANCLEYDEYKKEANLSKLKLAGVGAGSMIAVSAVLATCMAISPDMIRTGLLAKIANIGSTGQIIKAIAGFSTAGGAIGGAIATSTTMKVSGVNKGIKKMNSRLNELKPEAGKAIQNSGVDYDEQKIREERRIMKEKAMKFEREHAE